MKRFVRSLLLLAFCAPTAFADVSVAHSERSDLNVGGMIQLLGLGQSVRDPVAADIRLYLFMKEARFRVSGRHDRYSFNLELGLGGEDRVVAPNPGIALGLLDFSFQVSLNDSGTTYVKLGQFKVPYGREQLTYSGKMLFAERSLESLGFIVGRDVGVALVTHPGPMTLIGGVFTGGGRDVPPAHYLPQALGVPLLVARLGFGDGDQDPFSLSQLARAGDAPRCAFFINGLYTRDSLVGHSTVLNVKLADKSLLLNSNWNPYIGARPLAQGSWSQVGADFSARAPVGSWGLAAEAQVDFAHYENENGKIDLPGARAQLSLGRGPGEVALRYSVLFSSPVFAFAGVPITGRTAIHEVVPSVSLYLFGEQMKLVADLPLAFNVPVITEDKVGAYVATELPDETALLAPGKNGTVEMQTVVEGRLMLQAQF